MLEETVKWDRMAEKPTDESKAKYFSQYREEEIFYCDKCNIWWMGKYCNHCFSPMTKKAHLWLRKNDL